MRTVEEIQQVIAERIPEGLVVPAHTDEGHFYKHTGVNETYASVTTKGNILDAPHLKKWAASEAVKYIDKNLDIITPENKEEIFRAAILSHQDQFEEAGSIGTWGHGIVDEYLKEWIKNKERPNDIRTFVKTEDSRLYAITRSAEMFCKDFAFIPIASELRVASTKHKFGGTLDALGMVAIVKKKGPPNCVHVFWNRSSRDWWKLRCKNCGENRDYVFAVVDWKTSNSIDKPEYAMQTAAYWGAFFEMTKIRPRMIFIVRLDKVKAKYEIMQVFKPGRAYMSFLHAAKIYDWLHNKQDKLISLQAREKISIYD